MNKVKSALKILIQGESDAVETYLAFANKAEEEGYINISLLFRALIVAERIHIKNHQNALGEDFIPVKNVLESVESTLININTALIGETEENKKLYPKLIKSIKKETSNEYGKVAKLSMMWAQKVEKEHARLLKIAYKSLSKGSDLDFKNILICQVCGNVEINKYNKNECGICGHDSIFFKSLTEV
ncbi:MAG: rubrerythrin family protein [Spirochaetaceae bacterium]